MSRGRQHRREHRQGGIVLLDFTGQLDGPSDVPAVQLELGVEVLLSGDGGGVVRAGALGHVTLVGTRKSGCVSGDAPRTAPRAWECVTARLLPRCEWCVVQRCLRRTAEVSWSLSGNNVGRSTTNLLSTLSILVPETKSSGRSL